jgi:hypothetical protein
MYAHFQIFAYLDRFRNLDLFHQGEYSIRVRVFSEQTYAAARPLIFLDVDEPESPPSYPGGINDEDSSCRISSFYIRFGIKIKNQNAPCLLALPTCPFSVLAA